LDKANFEEYFEIVIQKVKKAITEYHLYFKKLQEKPGTSQQKPQISHMNKMLDQSLYILDLLPKHAIPLLIMFTDSNLCVSKLGKYNNILMQLNRVDINISIVDIYSTSNDVNLFSLGFVNNDSIMRHICNFTGGSYFTEKDLCEILKIERVENTHRNILNFNVKKEPISSNNQFNHIRCKCCYKNIDIFFCKKPYNERVSDSVLWVNNDVLDQVKKSIHELGFNFTAIDNLKITNGMKIFLKETVIIFNYSLRSIRQL
jgi:hypothetical protein